MSLRMQIITNLKIYNLNYKFKNLSCKSTHSHLAEIK